MSPIRGLALSLLLITLTPAAARADGFLIPFLGVNFAGDSGRELGNAIDASRLNYGVSLGYMGGGILGLEGDFGYSPDFFGKSDVGGTSLTSMMGNVLLGVPFGGQSGFGVRPYGLVGLGVLRTDIDTLDLIGSDENKFAWNFGGGVMLLFGRVGVRADLRYFRTFDALELLGVELGEESALDTARASAGFVVRF